MKVSKNHSKSLQELNLPSLPKDILLDIFEKAFPENTWLSICQLNAVCKGIHQLFISDFFLLAMVKKLPDRLEYVMVEHFQKKPVSNLNQFSKLMQQATPAAYNFQKICFDDRLPDEEAENQFLQNVQILFDFQFDKMRREAEESETPYKYVCHLEGLDEEYVESNGDQKRPDLYWQKLVYESQEEDLAACNGAHLSEGQKYSLTSIRDREQFIAAESLCAFGEKLCPEVRIQEAGDTYAGRTLREAEKWKQYFKENGHRFEQIKKLDLKNAAIRVIPKEIAYFKNLEILSIYHPIAYFPSHVLKCSKITFIFMHSETQRRALLTPLARLPNLHGRLAVFCDEDDEEAVLATSPRIRSIRADRYVYGEDKEFGGGFIDCEVSRSCWTKMC